ncbi:MAG: 1-pyrroline-5-carboxylate dehydrogenase [Cyanobacteria bacterium J06626_18]
MVFKRNHTYVKMRKDMLWVKHLKNRTVVKLKSPQPFSTERLLVGQVSVAEAALKSAVRQAYAGRRQLVSPYMLIQPLECIEGGVSEAEEMTLMELGRRANMMYTVVWVGPELTDAQVPEKFIELARRLSLV